MLEYKVAVGADRERDIVLSREVLVRMFLAVNLDILLSESLVVLGIEDITDLVVRCNVVVPVR